MKIKVGALSNLLKKVVVLETEAAEFGFEWETEAQIMQQIQSECEEIREHLQAEGVRNEAALQEEIGDLLHAVFSLCVFCKQDPESTLRQTLLKFERRLSTVKAIAKEKALKDLQGQDFETLMQIWDEAKVRVG